MTSSEIRAHAWCFGGLLDADWELCPRSAKDELRKLGRPITDEDYAPYCMSVLDPDFSKKVQPGDFIVGEESVGYGHDHDHSCHAMKGCKIGAVLCESATPYFLRNSFNLGLIVLEIPGIYAATSTGDELVVNARAGTVENVTTGWHESFEKLPEFLWDLVEAGGAYALAASGK